MSKSNSSTLESADGDGSADHAGEAPVDRYSALADADVRADPDLVPEEQEFIVRFAKDESTATVTTEIPSTVRDLLRNREFAVEWVRISDEDRFGARLTPDSYGSDGAPITGVKGNIPIGALKVLARSRTKDWPSLVVSDHRPESDDTEGSG